MAHPADWSGLARLIAQGDVAPREIVAVLGKTEGNGCVNDFTRAYAASTVELLLRDHGLDHEHMPVVVMSGGTEGVMSPHATIFTRKPTDAPAGSSPAMMIAALKTAPLPPFELGR